MTVPPITIRERAEPMDRLPALLNTAIACYGQGRYADADAALRAAMAIAPSLPDVLRISGICATALGDHRGSVRRIERAVRSAGRRSGPLLPDLAVALGNLAALLRQEGDSPNALATFRRACALAPDHRDAFAKMAGLAPSSAEAEVLCRRVVILAPERAEAWLALGRRQLAGPRPDDAGRTLSLALAAAPDAWEAHLLLGNAALAERNMSRAASCYTRAYRLLPNHGAASNLAVVLVNQGHATTALAMARRSAALEPDNSEVWLNFGSVLVNGGSPEDAVGLSRHALTLRPGNAKAHSNLLMALQNLDGLSPLDLFAEHRRFDAAHGRARTAHHARHDNAPDPDRPLRVGYVSSDFRQHVASCFFEPLLACHDPARVESVCYSDTASPDAVTRRLVALSGAWCETAGMAEDVLADRIRADRIDILVDLAGHSSGNRQTVFARRPAPIQVTWLGYPDTTGLSAMDYRLVDAVTDPAGPSDGLASETLVRLPGGFLCYWPPRGTSDPGPSPASAGRGVTFGSFNRLSKITPAVIALWSAVLERVPDSRLLMKAIGLSNPAMRDRVLDLFRASGVAADRLEFVAWSPTWLDHLRLYQRIDIALDCFPYNGTTTTCEALWMGVPMIGLLGDRHAARVGASLLSRIGLDDLVARSPDAYVDIAAGLAADRARLAGLRAGLRDHLRVSPLCDGPGFARGVEDAYRAMWRRWCKARAEA